jgi:hypothetical protein
MPIAEEVSDFATEKDITPRGKQTPTQIAESAAQSARAERTERHEEIIKKLEKVAKDFGFNPFKEEWSKLSVEDRSAIGLNERNRIGAIANSTPVEPMQTGRQPGADDE